MFLNKKIIINITAASKDKLSKKIRHTLKCYLKDSTWKFDSELTPDKVGCYVDSQVKITIHSENRQMLKTLPKTSIKKKTPVKKKTSLSKTGKKSKVNYEL